jgi:hypothetical protein
MKNKIMTYEDLDNLDKNIICFSGLSIDEFLEAINSERGLNK